MCVGKSQEGRRMKGKEDHSIHLPPSYGIKGRAHLVALHSHMGHDNSNAHSKTRENPASHTVPIHDLDPEIKHLLSSHQTTREASAQGAGTSLPDDKS
jgi:hypothetical protein